MGNVDILCWFGGLSGYSYNVVYDTANDGVFNWTVLDYPSTNCFIQVREHIDHTTYDCSDSAFTIVPEIAQTITVLSPNGGEYWTVGSTRRSTGPRRGMCLS